MVRRRENSITKIPNLLASVKAYLILKLRVGRISESKSEECVNAWVLYLLDRSKLEYRLVEGVYVNIKYKVYLYIENIKRYEILQFSPFFAPITGIYSYLEKLLKNRVFYTFDLENIICATFYVHIRVQHIKIRKYSWNQFAS